MQVLVCTIRSPIKPTSHWHSRMGMSSVSVPPHPDVISPQPQGGQLSQKASLG